MYKMIVSDLDETLLQKSGEISEANVAAIEAATKKGVIFVPNTGRAFDSIQPLLKRLGLYDQAGEYVISFNGGATVENKGNQVLTKHPLDFKIAKAVYDIAMSFDGTAAHVNTLNELFVTEPSEEEVHYMETRGVSYTPMTRENFTQDLRDKIIMKVIFNHPDMAQREAIRDAVMAQFPTQVSPTFSSNRYVEFNLVGVNKGTASLELGRLIGIKPEEIIAVGDNYNDLPMIEQAGLGVSVANGNDTVKTAADFVTEADFEHDAMAEVIERFILAGD